MRTYLLFCGLCGFFSLGAQSDHSPSIVFDSLFNHAREASLYREQVNWDSLYPILAKQAATANSIEDLAHPFGIVLANLGDTHGRIYHNRQVLAHFSNGRKPHLQDFDPEIYQQIQWGQSLPFVAKYLTDSVGYVRMVGLPPGDNLQMSKEIQDAVCAVQVEGVNRWIVDLRYNGGGNLFPMAEGIAHILGEGALGGAKGLTEAENGLWSIKNGDFYYDEYTVGLTNDCSYEQSVPVAVLLSNYTASSGEALAVMCKNRPETQFFGQDSHGMITVTNYYPIAENTFATISVSIYQDRTGKIYDKYVPVDEAVPFSLTEQWEEDPGIQKALEWLKRQ
ncbi:MAG: S41 family peptidase [Bacteroidota bacterium]